MKKLWQVSLFLLITSMCFARIPERVLVGYWQNWDSKNAPYLDLTQVDPKYNVVNVAFAIPKRRTTYNMWFEPRYMSTARFRSQIHELRAQGRVVNISIGGGGKIVELRNRTQKDIFVRTMLNIIETYDFDGIDIDLEGRSVRITGGSITKPRDTKVVLLINAIQEIMDTYQRRHGKKLLLTMAPETAFVQGGIINYGKFWGAYLPVIEALRYDIDLLYVQLYNSGTMRGIDGRVYTVGTGDFIVAMTEALLQGFWTEGGYFPPLREDQIVVGLPSCPRAAGSGHVYTQEVSKAMNYLLGRGYQFGYYALKKKDGYPNLRGMMTWSVNWDKVYSCGQSYEFAWNYDRIFNQTPIIKPVPVTPPPPPPVIVEKKEAFIYPKPTPERFFTQIEDPFEEIGNTRLICPDNIDNPQIWENCGVQNTSQVPLDFYLLEITKKWGVESRKVVLRR